MSRTYLITGANRGIGLEFVGQILAMQGDHQVIACCRDPHSAHALQDCVSDHPERARVQALEVTDGAQILNLAKSLEDHTVDVLINNAGIYGPRQFAGGTDMSAQPWLDVLAVNTVAPYLIAQALAPQLERSQQAVVANITSRMGSIADNDSGGAPVYRSSKAGLNAAMKSLALDWAEKNIQVLLLHPGWVQTDMGGSNALIDAQTSVAGMLKILERCKTENISGQFFHCDGSPLPW